MSILSNFEDGIAGLFENVSGSLFRSPVEPVQIVRAAEKEMIKGKLVGAGKTYAPTLYTVLLSPDDDANLCSFYPTLSNECSTYLVGKANEENLYLTSRPFVRFMTDDGLKNGKFSVIAESVSEEELAEIRAEEEEFWGVAPAAAASVPPVVAAPAPYVPAPAAAPYTPAPAPVAPAGAPPVPHPAAPASAGAAGGGGIPGIDFEDPGFQTEEPVVTPPTAPIAAPAPAYGGARRDAVLIDLKNGVTIPLLDSTTVGRDPSSTIVVEDVNVSRNHAQILYIGDRWIVRDLGSTNGTFVNDTRTGEAELHEGDAITFGVTRYKFREG